MRASLGYSDVNPDKPPEDLQQILRRLSSISESIRQINARVVRTESRLHGLMVHAGMKPNEHNLLKTEN